MKGFTVYASNRMEELVGALAEVVQGPLPDPFAPEVVIVQSRGMERWIVQELARRTRTKGFANVRFPFPNLIVSEAFDAVLGPATDADLFSPESMTWRIMRLLPARLSDPAFQVLRNYLGDDVAGLKGVQLASRIADTFDQYTIFRPEMVLKWEEGEGDDWQAELWRDLAAGHPGAHRAARRSAFKATLARNGLPPGGFPSRLSIFGVSSMPAFHLDVFAALSRHVDVHLIFLNPCRHYWGDIVSPREHAKWEMRRLRRTASSSGAEDDYRTIGHPLLGSWGRLGRAFLNLLLDLPDGVATEGNVDFVDPGRKTLLATLQSDILALSDATGGDGDRTAAKEVLSAGDRSIRIHSVHSPIREIEVLHDQLLDLMAGIEGLKPHEIVVMSPDIEKYAPYVTAVFGAIPKGDERHIPFTVADRPAGSENPTARAFSAILSLHGGRFGVGEVAELIESPSVARRFDFAPTDVEQIHRWVRETGIRWGADAGDRERHGLPAFAGNSWEAGFERLLLGYGMQGNDATLFRGVLPHEGVEGGGGELLGRFVLFARELFRRVRGLEADRALPEWADTLCELLDDFVSRRDDEEEGFQQVRGGILRLTEMAALAGFDGAVPLEVVRHVMDQSLGAERGGRGFLSRGVTFCEMLPMRSVPFKVVALVGMDGGAFPRQVRPPGFDKISADKDFPRPGDRSLPLEDRYIFLEALLSARDCFYVSYVGRSVVDNSERPPSVLVSELVDTVDRRFLAPEGLAHAHEAFVTGHRLQAFSPAYFVKGDGAGTPPLFTYSRENLEALAEREKIRKGGGPAENRPFIAEPLPDPPGERRHVSLSELRSFFRSPAEFFLKERVGLVLEREDEVVGDEEPFELAGLDRYLVKDGVLKGRLSGTPAEALEAAVRAGGVMPPGIPGEAAWREVDREVNGLLEAIVPMLDAEAELPAENVDAVVGEYRLTGMVDGLRTGGLLRFRCSTIRPNDLVAAWIDHLALCVKEKAPGPCRLLGKQEGEPVETVSFPLVGADESLSHLELLLDLYRRGWNAPLPFFPKTSFAYAKRLAEPTRSKASPVAQAVIAASGEWDDRFVGGGKVIDGEGRDQWVDLAFGEGYDAPRDAAFAEVAVAIFGPMLAATSADQTAEGEEA